MDRFLSFEKKSPENGEDLKNKMKNNTEDRVLQYSTLLKRGSIKGE